MLSVVCFKILQCLTVCRVAKFSKHTGHRVSEFQINTKQLLSMSQILDLFYLTILTVKYAVDPNSRGRLVHIRKP
jgi:hypothetical protein